MILVPDILPPATQPSELSRLPQELPAQPSQLDPIALLLADKRSEATKRAYRADLVDFFSGDPNPEAVRAFVVLAEPQIAARLAVYKAAMIARALSEATVNRRLSAIRSLLKLCRRLGFAQTDGRGLVDNERSVAYRDTRGISLAQLRRLIDAPGSDGLAGLRDTAILRVLCENALRRAELCALDVADFSLRERRLSVRGKGRGTQKELVTIARSAAEAIALYLSAAGHSHDALFRNLDRRTKGARLTPQAVYDLVRAYGARIGEPGLSPHKLRHSAITVALDLTGGDVRKVQRFSRHALLATLARYDDNRSDLAGEVTGLVAGALGG